MSNQALKQLRAYGEAREIRDQEWLRLHQEGRPTSAIAEAAGVSVQLVRRALAQARGRAAACDPDDPGPYILPIRGGGAPGDDDDVPPAPPRTRTPWWLELVPLFPVGAYTPASECPHRGPIEPGSLLCCMVCSSSGMDHHPSMKRDPATEPPPEPRKRRPRADHPSSGNTPTAGTRRERRARGGGSPGSPASPAA